MNLKQLVGESVTLEPLIFGHQAELYTAAQDERIWTYNGSKAYGERFHRWFEKVMSAQVTGEQIAYAVRRHSDQRLIGSTRYYHIDRDNARLIIGYTWYVPEVWGTVVNPTCKLLLLQQAFEEFQLNRVGFYTDARNLHSQAAIKKLGASEEGRLRQHMVLEDGFVRDTLVFSIIKTEWPDVKQRLQQRLTEIKKEKT